MGSYYGLGNWTKLPIEHDEDVFITTTTMKTPIIAKYFDYGEIYKVKIIGDFKIRDKDYNIVLTNENTIEEITKFINKNIKRPCDDNTEFELYIDNLFLYESFINSMSRKEQTIYEILAWNYLIPDNSCFCASQDEISGVQLVYYQSIYEFINKKM